MLKFKNVSKSFNNNQVLNNISFNVNKNEIVTVLGKNSAGKTTILNIILKLITNDEGTILFDGKDIKKYSNKEYFSKISVVLESSENVYNYLTGMQNIEYFLNLMNIKVKNCRKEIIKYLELFELKDDINKKVGNYSRGMIQKLAIIIALLSKPKLLLLDEPTLGLDIKTKYLMLEAIKKIVKEENISIILTTHQMEIVKELNSKILLLNNGKINFYNSCNDLYDYNNDTYQIIYENKGIINNKIIEDSFKNIYQKYQNFNIIEIKKHEQDLEKIIMEKLK